MVTEESERSDDGNQPLSERLSGIEGALEDLKQKPKDHWDQLQVLATLLVPIVVAVGSLYVSRAISEAQINSTRALQESEQVVAKTNAKVAQAQLIHSFLDELTGGTPKARQLAIEAVLLALPEEGERLVGLIALSDPDPEVCDFARKSLGSPDINRTIAAIAESLLAPGVKEATAWILRGQSLVGVATWADEIRGSADYGWTRPLRYLSIPREARGIDL